MPEQPLHIRILKRPEHIHPIVLNLGTQDTKVAPITQISVYDPRSDGWARSGAVALDGEAIAARDKLIYETALTRTVTKYGEHFVSLKDFLYGKNGMEGYFTRMPEVEAVVFIGGRLEKIFRRGADYAEEVERLAREKDTVPLLFYAPTDDDADIRIEVVGRDGKRTESVKP
ncbi:MAG: hypothetical protein AABW80_02110 [Nanoarchaeota archaeon]|mgnify:CR=1 FL=1